MELIAVFLALGIAFPLIGLGIGKLLRPKSVPNPIKEAPYESGEEAIGSPWGRFNPRYVIVGLFFLLFEVEIVLLMPLLLSPDAEFLKTHPEAKNLLVFYRQNMFWEALLFVGLLFLGLLWAWKEGLLSWLPQRRLRTNLPSSEAKSIGLPEDLYR